MLRWLRGSGRSAEPTPIVKLDPAQGTVYATFIERELEAETERRGRLDTRAAWIVTSSGTLIALLAAIGTLAAGAQRQVLARTTGPLLIAAAVAFIAAVAGGIAANAATRVQVVSIGTLRRLLGDRWDDDEVDARNSVSMMRVTTIAHLRRMNVRKRRMLTAAMWLQLAGALLLAAVVVVALG